ncbi:MAG: metallophosphoesterase [Deltaproteobacteria bacterium]|nr:metallophosphoesterase [Deltaproteobacteria bacterium]
MRSTWLRCSLRFWVVAMAVSAPMATCLPADQAHLPSPPQASRDSIEKVAVSSARGPGNTFHFAILGDNAGGTRPGVYASAIEHLKRMQPDFVISVGDLISGYDEDGALAKVAEIDRLRTAFDADLEGLGVPFFYVSGNNDMSTPQLHDDWRARYGPSYYSFVRGQALFIVLDSDDPPGQWGGGIGEQQLSWLEGVLKQHRDVDWTLVFLHRPMWVENAEAWNPVEKVLGQRPRTVFAGHWHKFFRNRINGYDYYVLATTGGASDLSGPKMGSFDHLVWVAMSDEGPRITNLHLGGIWDEDPVAKAEGELTTRIRREGIEVAQRLVASGVVSSEAPPFGAAQMNALGREYLFAGHLEEAETVLQLLLAGYPNSWRGHEGLGDIHRQRGELEQARQRYERVVEILPFNDYSRQRLEALPAPQ